MKKLTTVITFLLLVNCLFAQEEGSERIDSLKKRLSFTSKDTTIFKVLGDLAFQYSQINDYCNALEAGITAIKISEELYVASNSSALNSLVGKIYFKLATEDLAIDDHCPYYTINKHFNLLNAKKYISRSIEQPGKVEDHSRLLENSLLLSSIYEKLGASENALKFYKIYVSNKDSVFSADQRIKLGNLEKIKEVEIRDDKIRIQKLEIGHQRSQMRYQIILFLLMLIVISFILYSYYKTKVALNLAASEEKYRTIFETLQDIFYQTDLNGKIII